MRSCSSTESGLLGDLFSIQFTSRPHFLYFPTGLYHGIYDMCIYSIRDYSYVYSDVPTLYFTGHGMANLCVHVQYLGYEKRHFCSQGDWRGAPANHI